MSSALIGSTGFVAGNILKQRSFDDLFNSKNSGAMAGQHFDEVWFSALPAKKWTANQDSRGDFDAIRSLQEILRTITCDRFIHISTIDIYNDHEPYGRHRRQFEDWVVDRFTNHCIVRLPALFGTGLKKNLLFDLIAGARLDRIHVGDAYQWYDLKDLVADIAILTREGIGTADLFTEPIENRDLLRLFPSFQPIHQDREPIRYNYRSQQAPLFQRQNYIRSAAEMLKGVDLRLSGSTSFMRQA